MKISENYRKRLKSLSGIRLNEVELKATSGRSGQNTLSYYVEEYLLNLGGIFLDDLKVVISEFQDKEIELTKTESKISNNSITIFITLQNKIDENEIKQSEFSLNLMVKLESNSNTVAILKYENINDEFNLQSKHSEQDVKDFLEEITTRILNLEKIS